MTERRVVKPGTGLTIQEEIIKSLENITKGTSIILSWDGRKKETRQALKESWISFGIELSEVCRDVDRISANIFNMSLKECQEELAK